MTATLETVIPLWPLVSGMLSVPHTEQRYRELLDAVDTLIDAVGENEAHPLAGLLETLGQLVEAYENQHQPRSAASPIEILRALMAEHGLTQKELPEIGSQGVVSEILNEKRNLNVRQIRLLAKRFGISPEVFL